MHTRPSALPEKRGVRAAPRLDKSQDELLYLLAVQIRNMNSIPPTAFLTAPLLMCYVLLFASLLADSDLWCIYGVLSAQ